MSRRCRVVPVLAGFAGNFPGLIVAVIHYSEDWIALELLNQNTQNYAVKIPNVGDESWKLNA